MEHINIIADRIAERYSKLDNETRKKLDVLAEADISAYQLQTIKKSKVKPQEGDIFVVSPKEGVYFYGKVMVANIVRKIPDSFIEGNNVIFIFKCHTTEQNLNNYIPNYDDLLIPPMIVSDAYWKKGYFYTVGNIPLSEEENNLDFGFYKMHVTGNYFCKETGEILEKEPKILGMHGITTLIGVPYKIAQELIINPALVGDMSLPSQEDDSTVKSFLTYNTEEDFISLNVDSEQGVAILENIEEQFDVYMNGYNWEILLLDYVSRKEPELLKNLETDPEASSLVFYYDSDDTSMLMRLYHQIKQLIDSPQLIYDYISLNQDTIEWD